MNSVGQKQVDDFSAAELLPVRDAFLDGAYGFYGHTKMQRALGLGYQSEWAREHLPTRCERNRFQPYLGPPRAVFEDQSLRAPVWKALQRVADGVRPGTTWTWLMPEHRLVQYARTAAVIVASISLLV